MFVVSPHVPDCSPEPIFSIPPLVVYVDTMFHLYISVHVCEAPVDISVHVCDAPVVIFVYSVVTPVIISPHISTSPRESVAEFPVTLRTADPVTLDRLPKADVAATPVTLTAPVDSTPTAFIAVVPLTPDKNNVTPGWSAIATSDMALKPSIRLLDSQKNGYLFVRPFVQSLSYLVQIQHEPCHLHPYQLKRVFETHNNLHRYLTLVLLYRNNFC